MARCDQCGPPPTIGDLRALECLAFDVTCTSLGCRHTGSVRFDRAGMSDATVFQDVPRSRRLVCTVCGGRQIEIMPDWRGAQLGGAMGTTWGMMPPGGQSQKKPAPGEPGGHFVIADAVATSLRRRFRSPADQRPAGRLIEADVANAGHVQRARRAHHAGRRLSASPPSKIPALGSKLTNTPPRYVLTYEAGGTGNLRSSWPPTTKIYGRLTMIKCLSLASALVLALSTACFAQAGGSDREGGGGDKGAAAKAPQPVTPSAGKGGSDSDRTGGMEKKSDKPNSNAASAPVNSGGH